MATNPRGGLTTPPATSTDPNPEPGAGNGGGSGGSGGQTEPGLVVKSYFHQVGENAPIKNGVTIYSGDLVALDVNGHVDLADANGVQEAHGFARFPEMGVRKKTGTLKHDQMCAIQRSGRVSGLTNLYTGQTVYLSETAGCYTQDTTGFASNSIIQSVGDAISTTDVDVIVTPAYAVVA